MAQPLRSSDLANRSPHTPADREARIHVLIDHVEDDCYVVGMASVDEPFEADSTTPAGVGREVVQRSVAPIEIRLEAGDRHQLQAGNAKAFQIIESVQQAVERRVELLDVELIDDQVGELRYAPRRVTPLKRWLLVRCRERRELADIGRAGEGVGEPINDQGRLRAVRWGVPQLVAVEVRARLALVALAEGNGNGATPQVVSGARHL